MTVAEREIEITLQEFIDGSAERECVHCRQTIYISLRTLHAVFDSTDQEDALNYGITSQRMRDIYIALKKNLGHFIALDVLHKMAGLYPLDGQNLLRTPICRLRPLVKSRYKIESRRGLGYRMSQL